MQDLAIRQIELAIISHLLTNNESKIIILSRLSKEDFSDRNISVLFGYIKEYSNTNERIDEIIIKKYLESVCSKEKLNVLFNIIDEALEEFPVSINFEEHINIISDNSIINKLKKLSEEYLNKKIDINKASTLNKEFSEQVFRIVNSRSTKDISHISECVDEFIQKQEFLAKNQGKILGISTGFRDLDEMIGGFKKSELIILAARPSIGKTALALNFLLNSQNSQNPKSALIFSLEMSREQLMNRIVSIYSNLPTSKITNSSLSSIESTNIMNDAMEKLRKMKIYIDDNSSSNINDIEAKIHKYSKQSEIGIIIIDYLQLINVDSSKGQNRTQEVSKISRSLKLISKEYDIPVIALSQLSRGIEQRKEDDKKPKLSDLRESGAIEQDADIVLFLDYKRDEKDTSFNGNNDNIVYKSNVDVDVIIAKNRSGRTGEIKLNFNKNTGKYKDID